MIYFLFNFKQLKDYYHSILWMEEANERYYLLEKESTEINKSDILNILSISLYKQGNLKRALIINDKLIELGNWVN